MDTALGKGKPTSPPKNSLKEVRSRKVPPFWYLFLSGGHSTTGTVKTLKGLQRWNPLFWGSPPGLETSVLIHIAHLLLLLPVSLANAFKEVDNGKRKKCR